MLKPQNPQSPQDPAQRTIHSTSRKEYSVIYIFVPSQRPAQTPGTYNLSSQQLVFRKMFRQADFDSNSFIKISQGHKLLAFLSVQNILQSGPV